MTIPVIPVDRLHQVCLAGLAAQVNQDHPVNEQQSTTVVPRVSQGAMTTDRTSKQDNRRQQTSPHDVHLLLFITEPDLVGTGAAVSALKLSPSSIKPEVHNVSQRHYRRTDSRLQATRRKKLAKFGREVAEVCERRNKQTSKQTYSLQYFVSLTEEVMSRRKSQRPN